MRISDSVANYILQMLNDENGIAEIQRNELANTLDLRDAVFIIEHL